ncbi:MAG: 2-oxoglutarate dehydrogenase complex dihydrolipoyllysine-residue succinyltransferase [Alphaproteobacteria bacterium]
MTIEIKVPTLGESVTEAIVASWTVKQGSWVEKDQIVCELETDKVTLEVPAPASGILATIAAEEGAEVGIDAVLGNIDETAQKPADAPKEEASAPVAENKEAAPAPQAAASQPAPVAGGIRESKEQVLADIKAGKVGGAATSAAALGPQVAASWPDRAAKEGEEKVKMTRLRKIIASRLKEAQNVAAMLTTFNEVDMTAVMDLRKSVQDKFVKQYDIKLGFMSFFVKAVTQALKEFPAVNAEIAGDNIIFKNYYDIGVAVGTEQGLVVPVVRGADKMGFAEVEQQIIDYALKARAGKLGPKDMQGGTFTITNGGVYGSLLSTPILNAPQVGILGMHGIKQRPMVMADGSIAARPMMYLALSYDHRIIDGKEAVSFLVRIKEMIEDPNRMLLEV